MKQVDPFEIAPDIDVRKILVAALADPPDLAQEVIARLGERLGWAFTGYQAALSLKNFAASPPQTVRREKVGRVRNLASDLLALLTDDDVRFELVGTCGPEFESPDDAMRRLVERAERALARVPPKHDVRLPRGILGLGERSAKEDLMLKLAAIYKATIGKPRLARFAGQVGVSKSKRAEDKRVKAFVGAAMAEMKLDAEPAYIERSLRGMKIIGKESTKKTGKTVR